VVVLELAELVLVTVLLSELDVVLLVVSDVDVGKSTELSIEEVMLTFDVGEIADSIVVEVVNVLFACVCARTIRPDEDNESIARRLIAMTIPMLIFLPKPATFALTGGNLHVLGHATTSRSLFITITDESSSVGEHTKSSLVSWAPEWTPHGLPGVHVSWNVRLIL